MRTLSQKTPDLRALDTVAPLNLSSHSRILVDTAFISDNIMFNHNLFRILCS